MAAKPTIVVVLFLASFDVTNCLSIGPKIESKLDGVSATFTQVENTADQTANLLESNNRLMTTIVDILQKHDQTLQLQNQIMNDVVGLLQKHDEDLDNIKPQLKQEQRGQTEQSKASAELNTTERSYPTTTATPTTPPPLTTPPLPPTTAEPLLAKDCDDIWKQGYRKNGVFTINPTPTCTSLSPIQVLCDLETTCSGWIVIQQRFDGSVNFNTKWDNYKNGFGKLPGEHWIGLENLHRLTTTQGSYRLRVELEDYDSKSTYAEYSSISVSDRSTYYKLSIGTYLGIGGNSLAYQTGDFNQGMGFSTYDNDHAVRQDNCAEEFTGGWWFDACGQYSNLNGMFYKDPSNVKENAMRWDAWNGTLKALRKSVMMIRLT